FNRLLSNGTGYGLGTFDGKISRFLRLPKLRGGEPALARPLRSVRRVEYDRRGRRILGHRRESRARRPERPGFRPFKFARRGPAGAAARDDGHWRARPRDRRRLRAW